MGYKDKRLLDQVKEVLQDQLAIGDSKHQDKLDGVDTSKKIYSWETYHGYKKTCDRFVKWCKSEFHCKTLEQCKPHLQEWLDSVPTASNATRHTWASGVAKLYGVPYTTLIDKLPTRQRNEITRSREPAVRDSHFSEQKNGDLVAFARSTGLRRAELSALRGDKLVVRDGHLFVRVDSGSKGGKVREAMIIGGPQAEDLVSRLMKSAGSGKVFSKIPSCCDIHSYRREYANAVYRAFARPLEVCKQEPFWNPQHFNGTGKPKGGWDKNSVYQCRLDRGAVWYDKKAMMVASENLGHSRLGVVASHYLY